MKKFIKCLAVLFIALSFFGCKSNDDEFDASINEVFYTDVDPEGMDISVLERIVDILDKSVNRYYLVLDCRQPNKGAVKMIMQYDSNGTVKEDEYLFGRIFNDVNLVIWWNDVYWNITTAEPNKELKCYLEDESGRRSSPYTFRINLVD